MKLLSENEVETSIKKNNDELVDTNIRLRKEYREILQKLNSVKDDYEPDKFKKLKEFENFCVEIDSKKSKLLKEFKDVEQLIKEKKDLFFNLVEKQDKIEERIYQVNEREKKVQLRELYVGELEKKINEIKC